MEIKNWKEKIDSQTLLLGGMDWWLGNVKEFSYSEDQSSALVQGRNPHRARLKMDGDWIAESSCTCDDAAPCRHVVALGYAVEEEKLRRIHQEIQERNLETAEKNHVVAMEEYQKEEEKYQEALKKAQEEGERRVSELLAQAERQGETLSQEQLDAARRVPVGMEPPTMPEKQIPPPPAELRDVLVGLSDAEARICLAELAMQNEDVLEWLATRVKKEVPVSQVEEWQHQVEKDVTEILEKRKEDRERKRTRMRALRGKVSDVVTDLLAADQVMDAFETVCIVWNSMCGSRDYQEKGVPGLVDICRTEWLRIVEAGDQMQKKQMLDWFTQGWDRTGQFERILCDAPWGKDLLEEKLSGLEQKLAEVRKTVSLEEVEKQAEGSQTAQELGAGSEPMWLVPEILSLLDHLGQTDRIQELCREYHALPMVRRWETEWALRSLDYGRAVAVLEESVKMDKDRPNLLRLHVERLVQVYTKTGQDDLCRKACRFLVFSCEQWNTNAVWRLKELTPPEEWPEEFEKILKLPSMKNLKVELLQEEKAYDLLCDYLAESGTMEQTEACEEVLTAWNSDRFRDTYRRVLDRTARDTRGPSEYPGLVRRLLKLRSMPGGRDMVREMANDWFKRFGRRTALVDEMTRQGF